MKFPFPIGSPSGGTPAVYTEDIGDSTTGASQQEINAVNRSSIVNATVLYKLAASSFAQVLAAIKASPKDGIMNEGIVITFLTNDGWKSKQWNGNDWSNEENWTDFGGASVGNIYNVTCESPIQGYYSLCDSANKTASATHVSWGAKKAKIGLIISFQISASNWKTYQYIGKTVTEENWNNPDNWQDFGSLAAGTESFIIIDELCGSAINGVYTLASALQTLKTHQEKSGIIYAKKGLVISYRVSENVIETKQFQGEVTDFWEVGLWYDFGGGGKLEASDEPKEGGKDALSTGGAYEAIPTSLHVDTETEGVVKISLKNAKGDMIGDEEQFSVGTGGGGGGTGTVVNIAFEKSPLYINAGAEAIARAAIRSITMSGQQEQLNNIEKAQLIDRDTNNVLVTYTLNQASSADLESYDFTFDLSEYCKTAGTRRLQFVVTDDSGNKGTRNINLTAVDVTISSVQTLNYTASTALTVGGSAKSIPMYKFGNRQTNITVITEIMLGGEWKEFGRATVSDSYSHSMTIDPNNVLGTRLSHGAYLLRIHGVDENSGVVGNYLYTTILCIDESKDTPLIATRWYTDKEEGSVKLYQSVEVEYAVYDPTTMAAQAIILVDGSPVTTRSIDRSRTERFIKQVVDKKTDGSESVAVSVYCRTIKGSDAVYNVDGSVIDAVMKEGAIYAFDFANRSNSDADHSIVSGKYQIELEGANYSSNGFGTYNGRNALRIAERVTGRLNHNPFEPTSVESNGLGIQFCFTAKNCVDDDAKLISCFDETTGAGFYVTGKSVAIYCANSKTKKLEERRYKQGEEITVGIAVEPVQDAFKHSRDGIDYYLMKMYLNGEEVASVSYNAGSNALRQSLPITFDGTYGDLYLYYWLAWNDYFQFEQAFQNYLVKLTDISSMVSEYDFENVMASQQVTEYDNTTTKSRPQAQLLYNGGMPYIIECPYDGSDIEILDHTTSTDDKIKVTLYYYDPLHPWRSFVAYGVERKNQGTTSTLRPVKNPRYYLGKAKKIVPLFPDYDNEEALLCYKLFKCLRVLIGENNIPVQTITTKIDYSDSGGANDCGVCDMMNATYRAAGPLFMTPAQRAFDGTWSGKYTDDDGEEKSIKMSGLVMNHSTANHPVAVFRSKSDTGSNPYFHCKGNWKMDKKEELALGFKDTPGYNKGCLNWGKFKPYYGRKGETLTEIKTRFLADDTVDKAQVYGLMLRCGRDFKVMRYKNDAWVETTGSMQQKSGKWVVEGDVINPVEGFELLQYQDMDWFMGVASEDDLMAMSTTSSKWVKKLVEKGKVTATEFPAWTQYFESLIDDDDLAADYALGKRVPYNLLQWMIHCNNSDYSKKNLDDCKTNWRNNTWKYANIRSMYAYGGFCDYLLAIDQEAKNMQPMWFLEDGHCIINGVFDPSGYVTSDLREQQPMIMYWNKVYDADGVNGKDNDGGCTCDAETDPNKDSDETFTNPYAGHGSILFKMMYYQPENIVSSDGTTLTIKNAVSTLRSAQITEDGLTFKPFSPEGATYYFITKRLKRWPKRVSSYDGERKYIDFTATSDSIYFYALQGLGLTALPDFIDRRWRFRDGYYQTGDFFSGILSGRIACASSATIRIRAAKSGYFGIGNDSAGSLTESVYLEAGQEHTFTKFSHETGALLYIYQADRMSMLDLSQISLSDTFNFGVMTLVEELAIGSASHTDRPVGSYASLTSLPLGELPFLRLLNIERTAITDIDCSKCPRLETVKASASKLSRIDLADGATITRMELPDTYRFLKLSYLPNLTLDGLVLANAGNITTLIFEECEKIDAMELLRMLLSRNSQLKHLRIKTVKTSGDGTDLAMLKTLRVGGYDAVYNQCEKPVIIGSYSLTRYYEDDAVQAFTDSIDELLVKNVQYTGICLTDIESDPKNIKNMDNNTGYGTGADYEPSAHILNIWNRMHAVRSKFNEHTRKMEVRPISDETYLKYANGQAFDPSDPVGEGYDVMLRPGHFWYKGVNDYKNQLKYIFLSSVENTPDPSGEYIRKTLAELTKYENTGVNTATAYEGSTFADAQLTLVNNLNSYAMGVEGMKQLRFPGVNISGYGAVFVDKNNKVLSRFNMAISHTLFDFVEGDYVFCNVPAGAVKCYFCCYQSVADDFEAIATDSSDVEAIEPDWVEHKDDDLIGVYGMFVDTLGRARSVSGVVTRRGDGTSETSPGWTYDANGNVTNAILPSSLHYTCKDFMNVAEMRGNGYQCIDYEQNKIMAIMFWALTGNRNDQEVIGNGCSSGYTTGQTNAIGKSSTSRASGCNKLLGLEGFIACNYEWMDNIAFNVQSWLSFKKGACNPVSGDKVDYKFHIYDPISKTDREVSAPSQGSGCNVARVRNGRFCDTTVSKFDMSDSSKFITYYACYSSTNGSTGRVVGRANSSANASGGLAYAYTNNASSFSYTYYGSRLAFRGEIVEVAE